MDLSPVLIILSFLAVITNGACPKPSVTSLKSTKDWSLLQCEVKGASPRPKVEWRDSSGNILHAEEPQVTERGGSYDIILNTNVTKNDHYSCVVTQNEFCHQISSNISVNIHEPEESTQGACPKPSVTSQSTKDQVLLQCEVYGASPRPEVEWRDSSGNILHAEEPQVTEREGSYDIILNTTVTKTDTYSCVVTQNEFCHQTSSNISVYIDDPEESTQGSIVGWIVAVAVLSALLVVVFIILAVLFVTGCISCRKGFLMKRLRHDDMRNKGDVTSHHLEETDHM
nr:uncharacterized protein LOC109998281 [Labrus bergylta]